MEDDHKYQCAYEAEAPILYYDRLSSLLKECASHPSQQQTASGCPHCDDRFFASVSEEVSAVTRYFNRKVQWLLQLHLASGFKKVVLKLKHKEARSHLALIQEGKKVLEYASTMTLAANNLLEYYDKVHSGNRGLHFKAQLVGTHMEVPQSPWLIELLALYFNLQYKMEGSHQLPLLCPGCICEVRGGKLTLSCMPNESLKLEIEVICPICLEMVFEPIALSCGHMLCFSCACTTASVHTYDGLKKARRSARCPLCRESNVFSSAILLTELNLLTYRRCRADWKSRRERERKGRLKEIKEHWKLGEDVWTKPLVYG